MGLGNWDSFIGGYVVANLGVLALPLLLAFLVSTGCVLRGPVCEYRPASHLGHEHHHGHDHGPNGHGHTTVRHPGHGAHDGIVVPFYGAQSKVGYVELKLHDDKGDLEMWLSKDAMGAHPYDIPLDSEVTVWFSKLAQKNIELKVRNRTQNQDESGKVNIRGKNTNYFIFPGNTGADATFLIGKEFASTVSVSFLRDGVVYVTDPFELRPHTH